jgi:hypothetical protein
LINKGNYTIIKRVHLGDLACLGFTESPEVEQASLSQTFMAQTVGESLRIIALNSCLSFAIQVNAPIARAMENSLRVEVA